MNHPACQQERKKETPMNPRDQHQFTTDLDTAALPAVADRATWQAELDALGMPSRRLADGCRWWR
jgi:hypothetical protein